MKEWYESHLTKPWMKKYFSFTGRIGRKSYILRFIIANVVSQVIGTPLAIINLYHDISRGSPFLISTVISYIILLVYALSSFSLWVRRLHDLDKEGKYLTRVNAVLLILNVLLGLYVNIMAERDINTLITYLNSILSYQWYIVIAFLPWALYTVFWGILCIFKKGTEGPNRFGEDPLFPVKIESMEGK